MKTPIKYKEALKNNVITFEMLEQALYSINKRAKNCRDKAQEYYKIFDRQYRNYLSPYYTAYQQQEEKKQEYYGYKDFLLENCLIPDCIHFERLARSKKRRIYSNESDYKENLNRMIDGGWHKHRIYIVVEEEQYFIEKYYLFYKTENYSYHRPIDKSLIEQFPNLEIIEINDLKTNGKQITDLVSMQFVRQVLGLVKSGNYRLES